MPIQQYPREIKFDAIFNFRDLGGYQAKDNHTVAWRRLFRSGELRNMTQHDTDILKKELRIKTAIDLRSSHGISSLGIGLLDELEIKYYSIPLYVALPIDSRENAIEKALFRSFTDLGEIYAYVIREPAVGQNIIKILEIIADRDNLPLVFHCNAGQSRTGIIAAVVLSVLGVSDQDIIRDYTLTDPHMHGFVKRWNADPKTADVHKTIPPYENEAKAESIVFFLSALKREYGSVREYLEMQGAEKSLFDRLEQALLIIH
jgi:protein-tyrosine phosphatase